MGCSSSRVEAPRQDRLATPIVHDDGIATVQRKPGDPANFPAPAPGIALDPLMQHCPANLSPEDEDNEEEGKEPVRLRRRANTAPHAECHVPAPAGVG